MLVGVYLLVAATVWLQGLSLPLRRVQGLSLPLRRVQGLSLPLRRVQGLSLPLRRVQGLSLPLRPCESDVSSLGRWREALRLPTKAAGVEARGGDAKVGVPASAATPTLNFELNRRAPLLQPDAATECTLELVTRSFANSYAKPSLLHYSPASFDHERCTHPSAWTGLILTIRAASIGRQFDRLGTVWVGNHLVGPGVEVWRTDNPEPTATGIEWATSRDVGKYFALFRDNATIIFDFPNIVDRTYTGLLNVTLSITAYVGAGRGLAPLAQRAPDLVLPISQRKNNDSSLFQVGGANGDGVASLKIPQNAARASVEIFASGTALEEFYYTLIPDRFFQQLTNATHQGYYGHGPYREVQLYIDGRLAGLAAPYPVIYTGGINPLLWRPSASFGAFESPTYSIDITPFLGSLTDGQEHEFRIKVASGERDGRINDGGWFVSGNVAVFQDESNERTTGEMQGTDVTLIPPVSVTGHLQGDPFQDGNLTFVAQLASPRRFEARGTILTGSERRRGNGPKTAIWTQEMSYENRGTVQSSLQINIQRSYGWTRSTIIEAASVGESEDGTDDSDRGARGRQIHLRSASEAGPGDRSVQELTFSYPLTAAASQGRGSDGSAEQRTNVIQAFVRRSRYYGPSVAADLLIGNEEVLGREARGGDWSLETRRNNTVLATQVDRRSSPEYRYNSKQTFSYRDVAGDGVERMTQTRDGAVVRDDLGGSLSERAQPKRLVVAQ
ncbi:hypothetical protein ACQY0O_008080 [Thecaphora frezii]